MPNYIEKAESMTLPVVVLKGIVAFPSIPLNFEVNNESDMEVLRNAAQTSTAVLLLAAKEIQDPPYQPEGLYRVGTVAKVKQLLSTSEGTLRVISEGSCRGEVSLLTETPEGRLSADVVAKNILATDTGLRGEALMREALLALEEVTKLLTSTSDDFIMTAKSVRDPGLFADFIASNVMVKYEDKQAILEAFDPMKRVELLTLLLNREKDLLACEVDIHKKVRFRLGQAQRERYLQEQLRVIQEELGVSDGDDDFYNQILNAHLPHEVEEKLLKENERLAKTPFGAAESVVLRSYLETCLELPWTKATKDRTDVKAAAAVLDKDHYGLTKVKERILEFIAVKQLNPDLKSQIICLVGPPGVGKTSIATSLARAMKRKYVRVSLGGIHDEADIRGHRKTYVGAMPGRIINALVQAKVKNPLILLDEIDKIGHDVHGDPASALLEVLDAEQNKAFRDHFVELPFDLSDCVFIATANTLDTIPRPLIDRMEIIELSTYTRTEKLHIAKDHLIPKQLKRHGLTRRTCKLTDDAIYEIIDYYTREAGVRGLEKQFASIFRKVAMKLVSEADTKAHIDASDVKAYLGPRKLLPETIAKEDEVGLVNGLAYTEVGGDLLEIEVVVPEGTGKIELTGSLGDVMKESAHAAISYIRTRANEFGIPSDFYKTKDIHIHVPEGAVPKDGPSAGVTMMTALVSALTGIKVRRNVAMTGEITLRGRVLPIGGLKEKTMAAYTAGVTTVLIPFDNQRDLEEIDPEAREHLIFVPCKNADDVLKNALVSDPSAGKTTFPFLNHTAPARANHENDALPELPPLPQDTPAVRPACL